MGRQGLVYVGSVHGRHVIVRLVQCLGSFVYLKKKKKKEVEVGLRLQSYYVEDP